MNVLSVVHSEYAGTELFGPLVVEAGHELDEWGFGWGTLPPRPLDSYDAVLIFGGGMHVDQEDEHPWLRDESQWLRALLEGSVPVFGVCLGSQLIAQATGAEVGPLAAPEIGWTEVELTNEGAEDSVLSVLPTRFEAFHWHHYAHELPDGAVALARNAACLQAFRLGERCWGVQFHPEVTEPQLEGLIVNERDPAPDPERLLRQTRERIGRWNELGRRLCRAFLAAAEDAAP
jgi:GMP synthase-like glutamine amidotransferase